MILASGARGPGLNSRLSPKSPESARGPARGLASARGGAAAAGAAGGATGGRRASRRRASGAYLGGGRALADACYAGPKHVLTMVKVTSIVAGRLRFGKRVTLHRRSPSSVRAEYPNQLDEAHCSTQRSRCHVRSTDQEQAVPYTRHGRDSFKVDVDHIV